METICRMVPFPMNLNDSNPDFKITLLLDAKSQDKGTAVLATGSE